MLCSASCALVRRSLPARRTLQAHYLDTLIALYATPAPEAPGDARALARAELVALEADASRTLRGRTLDRATRAHIDLLRARAHDALHAAR